MMLSPNDVKKLVTIADDGVRLMRVLVDCMRDVVEELHHLREAMEEHKQATIDLRDTVEMYAPAPREPYANDR